MLQPDADPRALTPEAGAFATTRWSLVLEAADPRGEGAAAALESLCKAYWYPLYAFARRSGHSPDDSQDLTQAFFAQFLARRALAQVDQRKGRFRTFLLRCMKNHMTSEWRKGNTLRRGGGVTLLPLDAKDAERRYQEEPASPDATPELAYDQRWADAVLGQVLARLRREYERQGKPFDALKVFLVGGRGEERFADVAAQLGTTTGALKTATHRMRRRYWEIFRDEIAQTVSDPGEIDDEIRHLLAVMGG